MRQNTVQLSIVLRCSILPVVGVIRLNQEIRVKNQDKDSAAPILAILTITSSPTAPARQANSWQTAYGLYSA
jgi:hypothetical protein